VRENDVDFLRFLSRGMVDALSAERPRGHRRKREECGDEEKNRFPEQGHIVSNFGSTSVEMKKNVTRLNSAAGAGMPSSFTATYA